VQGLDIGGGAVESMTVETADGTEEHDVDGVVVAAMPTVLESLTGYPCDIDFQGTVCSVISMDESLTDTYWLNVADEAPFGALIRHTNFVPEERYGGENLLYAVSYVQSMDDPLWQADDDGVEETWLSGIEDLFPGFDREAVNWIETARNPGRHPSTRWATSTWSSLYDLSDEGGRWRLLRRDGLRSAVPRTQPQRRRRGGLRSCGSDRWEGDGRDAGRRTLTRGRCCRLR